MKLFRSLILTAALAFGQASAEVELKAATHKEQVQGDLKGAIQAYRRIVAKYGQNRAVAAQALLHMAACQEKMGTAEARKTYQEILRRYADQKDAVAFARRKLGAPSEPANETRIRQVWSGPAFGSAGGISPDGRYWGYMEQSSYRLMQFDVATASSTVLFDGSGWRPLYSPDGKLVAFGVEGKGGYRLGIKTAGSDQPPAFKELPFPVWTALDWFPDSQHLFIMGTRDFQTMELVLAAVHLPTGEVREISRLSQQQRLNDMSGLVSRDGKWILFEGKSQAGASDRDILIAPAAGGAPRTLIGGPSEDFLVALTPVGTHLVYRNNSRSWADALYALRFDGGAVSGDPVLLSTMIPARAGFFDRGGAFYYDLKTGGESAPYLVDFDSSTGKATSAVKPLPGRGLGEGQTNWAGNSDTVILHRYAKGRMIEVAIADANTGRETHALQTASSIGYRAFVRPDGSAVLNMPTRPDGRYADIDWKTGALKMGTTEEGKSPESVCGGPTTMTSTTTEGVFVRDHGTNRHWKVQARSDLERSTTMADVSPDCRRMVVRRTRKGAASAVLFVDLVSGQERELVSVPAGFDGINFPRLTPDGKRVVFVAVRAKDPVRELWSVPIEGGAPAPTGAVLVNMREPRFSPDGKRLLLQGGQYVYEAYKAENLLPPALRGSR